MLQSTPELHISSITKNDCQKKREIQTGLKTKKYYILLVKEVLRFSGLKIQLTTTRRAETRMTASVLEQDPNTQKVQTNAVY